MLNDDNVEKAYKLIDGNIGIDNKKITLHYIWRFLFN